MELSDLVALIRRYWLPIVLVPLITAAAVWVLRPDRSYTARATVQVLPEGGVANLNDQSVALLMPAIVARVDSDTFANTVRSTLTSDVAAAAVNVSANGDTTSGLLTLTASSPNASAVVPWANAYASELITSPGSVDGYAVMRPVAAATSPSLSSSSEKAVVVGAALAALLLTLLVVLGIGAVRMQQADPARRMRRFGAPVLAVVPARGSRAPEIDGGPLLAMSPAIRSLVVEVAIARREQPFDTLAVVSDRPGTGCSTIASAFGWTLARSGVDVVMVDADFRRASQSSNLGVEPAAFTRCQAIEVNPKLTYMRLPENLKGPAAMLSKGVPDLGPGSRSDGAITVIDTPPFTDGPEADAVAVMAGNVLLVVSGHRTDTAAVRQRLGELRARQVRVLGLVINHPRRRLRSRPALADKQDLAGPVGWGSPAAPHRGADGNGAQAANNSGSSAPDRASSR